MLLPVKPLPPACPLSWQRSAALNIGGARDLEGHIAKVPRRGGAHPPAGSGRRRWSTGRNFRERGDQTAWERMRRTQTVVPHTDK